MAPKSYLDKNIRIAQIAIKLIDREIARITQQAIRYGPQNITTSSYLANMLPKVNAQLNRFQRHLESFRAKRKTELAATDIRGDHNTHADLALNSSTRVENKRSRIKKWMSGVTEGQHVESFADSDSKADESDLEEQIEFSGDGYKGDDEEDLNKESRAIMDGGSRSSDASGDKAGQRATPPPLTTMAPATQHVRPFSATSKSVSRSTAGQSTGDPSTHPASHPNESERHRELTAYELRFAREVVYLNEDAIREFTFAWLHMDELKAEPRFVKKFPSCFDVLFKYGELLRREMLAAYERSRQCS